MEDLKLAVLIDADNISPKYVKVILDEAASFGVAACKRIYGDWSDARLKTGRMSCSTTPSSPSSSTATPPAKTRPTPP